MRLSRLQSYMAFTSGLIDMTRRYISKVASLWRSSLRKRKRPSGKPRGKRWKNRPRFWT